MESFKYLNKTYSLASAEEQVTKYYSPTSLNVCYGGKRRRAWDQRSERRGEANAANVLETTTSGDGQ